MILNIRVTDEAIEYLRKELGSDNEEAEEVARTVVSLCDIRGDSGPSKAEVMSRKLRRDLGELLEEFKDYPDFDTIVRSHALRFESVIDQYFNYYLKREDREGEGRLTQDRIFEILADVYTKDPSLSVGVPGLRMASEGAEAIARALQEGEGSQETRLRRAARELVEYYQKDLSSARTLLERDIGVRLSRLVEILSEALEEGEGSEDRLYKTAKTIVDYFEEYGPDRFRAHFGSLDILEPARKVIEEGEGNPHPWE